MAHEEETISIHTTDWRRCAKAAMSIGRMFRLTERGVEWSDLTGIDPSSGTFARALLADDVMTLTCVAALADEMRVGRFQFCEGSPEALDALDEMLGRIDGVRGDDGFTEWADAELGATPGDLPFWPVIIGGRDEAARIIKREER